MKSRVIAILGLTCLAGYTTSEARADSPLMQDPCIQAAVTRTNEAFPLNKPTEGHFSDDNSKWHHYSDDNSKKLHPLSSISNLGVDPNSPKYMSAAEVNSLIAESYSNAESFKEKLVSGKVQDKKVFSLSFNFDGNRRLVRHFMVVHEGSVCLVDHIDDRLDDFNDK